jgi:hypothetical protein
MKVTKGAERRKWERLPLAIPVFVRGLDPNGRQFVDFATALDISVGGALLAIHRFLPKGSKIMLEIPSAPLNAAPKPATRTDRQRFYAKTVRVTDGEQCKLIGLQFNAPLKLGHELPSKPKAAMKSKARAKAKSV